MQPFGPEIVAMAIGMRERPLWPSTTFLPARAKVKFQG
jgi:hypothetical protein